MNKKIASVLFVPAFTFTGCTSITGENVDQNTDTETEGAVSQVTTTVKMNGGVVSTDDAVIETADSEKGPEFFVFEGVLGAVGGGDSTGIAVATFEREKYIMVANVENIPDPDEGFFYEGWIVRKAPFDFISTGKLENINGKWINSYESGADYTDHTRYVLTIEPDDRDPAPADHVVEGDMYKK